MGFHSDKLREAILFFANHPAVHALGVTKLYKLLYYADVRRLRESGATSITGSEYIRYPHGPVPSRAERVLEGRRKDGLAETPTVDFHGFRLSAVHANRQADLSVFSAEELACLETVARELGGLTASKLSDRSHAEPAWVYAGLQEKLDPTLMLYGGSEDPEGL